MDSTKNNNREVLKHNVRYVMLVCCVAAIGGLLFGYDSSVISGAIEPLSEYYQLSPGETGWAVSNVIIGCVIGCFSAGYIADKLGRKKTLIITAILFIVSIAGTAFALDFQMFVVFRIIGGLAIGIASVISPVYISEVAPKDYRGRAGTVFMVLCVGGQVVVLITNYIIAKSLSSTELIEIGWRWMLMAAFIPCIIFFICVIPIPESPRWNIMVGNDSEAFKTLSKISNEEHAKHLYQEIKDSFELEKTIKNKDIDSKHQGYTWIFLFIAIGLAVFNQLTGINVIQYFGPSLLQNVTGNIQEAMFMTIWLATSQFIGVLVGMIIIDKIGRTSLLKLGSLGAFITLLYTFFAFYYQFNGIFSVIGLFGFMFLFGASWGQVVWPLIGEIFPNRVRAVGMGVAISTMWLSNFVISQTFPLMNKSIFLVEKFHGGFPLLIFAITSAISFIFVQKYVPETKGVSLEKMEDIVLRKFKKVN